MRVFRRQRKEWVRTGTTRPGQVLLTAALILLVLLSAGSGAGAAGEDVINIPVTVTGNSPGSPFRIPRAVFCDQSTREVYVADAGAGQILIFDDRGWPVYRFTHWVDGPKGRRKGEPNAVVATASGNIFVSDGLSPLVDILDYRGRPVFAVDPVRFLPTGEDARTVSVLALGPDGNVYTSCKSGDDHFLLGFDETGGFLSRTRLGRSGQLERITGLDVGARRVVVSDMNAEFSVQVFDRQGKRLLAFGRHDAGWGNFSFPSGVTVAPDGSIWVVDMIRQIVNRFDKEGNFTDFIGGRGEGPGSMAYPCSVAHDPAGRVVVLEKVGCRYQVFDIRQEVTPTP